MSTVTNNYAIVIRKGFWGKLSSVEDKEIYIRIYDVWHNNPTHRVHYGFYIE